MAEESDSVIDHDSLNSNGENEIIPAPANEEIQPEIKIAYEKSQIAPDAVSTDNYTQTQEFTGQVIENAVNNINDDGINLQNNKEQFNDGTLSPVGIENRENNFYSFSGWLEYVSGMREKITTGEIREKMNLIDNFIREEPKIKARPFTQKESTIPIPVTGKMKILLPKPWQ